MVALFMDTALPLPLLKEVSSYADFSLTVRPFLGQLAALSANIVAACSTDAPLVSLAQVYLTTNPLVSAFALSLAFSVFFLLLSEATRNHSQVDRAWSMLPPIYVAHYALWARGNGIPAPKVDNALVVAGVWGARLTFNFWRKGGYSSGGEDYRWEIIRGWWNAPTMFVFNVFFIALAQNVLLFLITTPVYLLLLVSRENPTMELPDIIFSRVLMGLILVETFADQQQWNFQQAKKQYNATAKVPLKYSREDLDRGFVVSGLWAWSRHPNFAAEQAIWLVFYQWACYATQTFFNWTVAGALGYLMLFQASTRFTEQLSAQKYPEYAEYQRLVGKFIPTFLGRGSEGKEEKRE
ncbi:DUF1295-domain-containing protein [Trichodelitschia bisporula]|uniref:DUF1295-domain-containing protein n=1 Tax=Trichodelitschia bisporula TaxID=703511 RepID=A0A6G1HWJ2_9PEZI|nr:DUF1295-domain-containing protein [Trichodelitschia bisporula]